MRSVALPGRIAAHWSYRSARGTPPLGDPQLPGHDALVREDDLLELVDQGKFAELYDIVRIDDVADAWLAHLRGSTKPIADAA